MCMALPMQIVAVAPDGHTVQVARGDRLEHASLLLVGPLPVGTWVLVSLGLVREVLADAQRALIEDALAALTASLEGRYQPDQHFTDLAHDPFA